MRYRSWDQRRDLVVRLLARLSLVVVLAVLGAMFVGSAATSQAAPDQVTRESTVTADRSIRPVGLLIGAAVIGGGVVVLLVGAFRPPTSRARREHGELQRQ